MERFALTLLVLAFFALCAWGMWRGWRRQAREQSARIAPFPDVPEQLGPERDVLRGIYVATTRSGRWQDRIVTRGVGMRGPATLRRYDEGVVVERDGAPSFFVPAGSLRQTTTARGMAGKVMGTDALLVLTWQHDGAEFDTGFRGDRDAYASWLDVEETGGRL